MGIIDIISKTFKQVAVYWPAPKPDGYGSYTYDSPEEIACRWIDMNQLISDNQGNQITSMAMVYVKEDLDIDGMLYLGELDDLSSDGENDPKTLTNAFAIKRFEKIPVLGSANQFVRKAFLTYRVSMGGL
jgi:hypothetical protein